MTTRPLDPLAADELRTTVEVLRREGHLSDGARLVDLSLHEPAKGVATLPREAFAIVNHRERGATEVIVSLADSRVVRATPRPGVQPAVTTGEFAECERVIRADDRYLAALNERGIADPDRVFLEAWGFGGLVPKRYEGRRLAWAPAYYRPTDADNPYARPIEGLFAIVDLNEMSVLEIVDTGVVPLPREGHGYFPEDVGPLRDDVRPLEIVQPEGPSFSVDGWELEWQKWRLNVGFTPHEGLVLHTVTYDGRSVMHRASCAELVVPYGEPGPAGFIKTPFDAGEFGLGTLANSLTLGCDCLGEIRYFDVDLCDDRGEPYTLQNAICLHEEDAGLLWKHVDGPTGRTEVRRSRRLVLSFIATLSNYEYAFYWHLYQDGSIGVEFALTGIVLTAALAEGEAPRHGTLVGERLAASYHQHFFTVRLDLDLDGAGNTVVEVDTTTTPAADNPYGYAFETTERPLRSEAEGERRLEPSAARFWRIVNPSVLNAHGLPVGYRLTPGPNVLPFADAAADVMRRAPFLRSPLWVTRYDPEQRFPAGAYPNQADGPDGLTVWAEADRSLENEDVVVWYTVGSHHIPRPEDWPVMPVERTGFMLRPDGFFGRSAALDVPPSPGHGGAHCHS